MPKNELWNEFKTLDNSFGTGKSRLCKKHGFITSLKGWNYCPYCGEEMCG